MNIAPKIVGITASVTAYGIVTRFAVASAITIGLVSLTTLNSVRAAEVAAGKKDGGKGYELGGPTDKPLFFFSKTPGTRDGLDTSQSSYTDPAGKVLVAEDATFTKNGGKTRIKTYRIEQKQIDTVGVIEVKDGRIEFNYTKDGKTKTSSEKTTDDFIVGPGIVSYIQENWDAILKGNTVKARLGVPDRLETVGFEYFKEKDDTIAGEKVVTVKMKPTSFIIAAIVNPLRFSFTPDGQRVVEIRGRTQVKREDGKKYKDLDALIVYDK